MKKLYRAYVQTLNSVLPREKTLQPQENVLLNSCANFGCNTNELFGNWCFNLGLEDTVVILGHCDYFSS